MRKKLLLKGSFQFYHNYKNNLEKAFHILLAFLLILHYLLSWTSIEIFQIGVIKICRFTHFKIINPFKITSEIMASFEYKACIIINQFNQNNISKNWFFLKFLYAKWISMLIGKKIVYISLQSMQASNYTLWMEDAHSL